ncbi:MAG: hypothetical protein KTR16_14145 [Acidiferrobacterales bacterium]|nr:hypothetical protein [Acidiferrobacterales bacterium]
MSLAIAGYRVLLMLTTKIEDRVINKLFCLKVAMLCILFSLSQAANAQTQNLPLLPDNDTILLTVFLKHDQSMIKIQRRDVLKETC